MRTTIPQHDAANDLPSLPHVFFAPGVVSTVFLFRLTQSAHRASTRGRALDALVVALLPVIEMAVKTAIAETLRPTPSHRALVDIASADFRRVVPTMRVASADDLILHVANRAYAVCTGAVPMAPQWTTAPVGHRNHLLRVLPPPVLFALLGALYPALDARTVEMLTRMTHIDASWDRVARTLGMSCDALQHEYTAARARAEDCIVHEIARRQPWPTVATVRIAAPSHLA